MPSFTNFAIKTLLEPTTKTVFSSETATYNPNLKQPNNPNSAAESKSGDRLSTKLPVYIKSPALYTTPELKPIPPGASAQSVTPSPYLFNRKRRDVQTSTPDASINHRVDGFEIQGHIADSSSSPQNFLPGDSLGETEFRTCDGEIDGLLLPEKSEGVRDSEEACHCEARSVPSCNEVDDFAKQTVMSPRSVVFFDADEEFFSDGSVSNKSSSHISKLESELCSTKISLLEEIEKRKAAEDAVNHMRSQWQRIGRKLSKSGLTFPTPLPASSSLESQAESVEQFIQELVVTRFVYEAIGTGQARAEAEVAASAIIESKNQEISRLRDRLQYYETVNKEMSNRNQEVVEIARRQREKRHQKNWIYGCVGMSVAVGASVIAYSYLPRASADLSATTTSD